MSLAHGILARVLCGLGFDLRLFSGAFLLRLCNCRVEQRMIAIACSPAVFWMKLWFSCGFGALPFFTFFESS